MQCHRIERSRIGSPVKLRISDEGDVVHSSLTDPSLTDRESTREHSYSKCCTSLVCGAHLTKVPPFFSTAIVPVIVPPAPGQYCSNTTHKYCVDKYGIIRPEGSEWFVSPCEQCTCRFGDVICNSVIPDCPPPPEPHCRPIPGDCCNTWDCEVQTGCIDSEGNHHDLGETWPDLHDPCQIWICTPNGPVRRPIKECDPLPPQPHPRCTVVVEDCCRTWSCPGCVDNNGIPREEGSRWEDPSDPCILYMCINGRIQSFPKTVFEPCPSPGPKPHDRCVYALIDCCHQWNCTTGCVDAYGQQHNVGDVWTDPIDRCFILTCTSTGIQRSPVSCPPLEPVLAVLTIKDITMLVTRGLIHMTTATVIPATTLALRGIQSPVQPLVPDLITLAPWSLMDAAGIGHAEITRKFKLEDK
ncbi:hypothetical protein Pmani_029646 [Petrolisthes manimaculis]|uniref:VWFC domain-containing protein n=1 Tax=Petrolisthes manimaculis TaxID=1843537 RepID=A0AAE1NYB3_9EUCA|nr:hypothetical protein Pmani_029646 [Petrolisthes manimaculis]